MTPGSCIGLVITTPPADLHIFHVMALRESTRNAVGYEDGEQL